MQSLPRACSKRGLFKRCNTKGAVLSNACGFSADGRIEEAMRASGGEFEKFVQEIQRGAV